MPVTPNVKGETRRGGREPGTPNALTVSIKNAFREAFDEMGGVPALVKWAKTSVKTKTEFYKIVGKMIPIKLVGDDGAGGDAPLEIPIVFVGGQAQLAAPSAGLVFDASPSKLPHLNGNGSTSGAASESAGGSKPTS